MIITPGMRADIRAGRGVKLGLLGDYPIMAHDWEFNPNVSIFGFLNMVSGEVFHFSNMPGLCRSFDDLRTWWPTVEQEYFFIGFNSLGIDNHGLQAVLNGVDDPQVLYDLGQSVIEANQGIFLRRACHHAGGEVSVDIMAICRKQGKAANDEGGLGSLKELGIKLGYPMLRSLPYPVGSHLSFEQAAETRSYNVHDLNITAIAAQVLQGDILSRIALSVELHVNVVNDSDAKLAERIMQRQLFGNDKPFYPTRQEWVLRGKELVEGFSYNHPELQALRSRIAQWKLEFQVVITQRPDGKERKMEGGRYDEEVKIGETTYAIGKGGLHTMDLPMLYEPTEAFEYWDFDVTSYYPSIISNYGLAPEHLPRHRFLAAFNEQRQRRNEAKARAKQTGSATDKAINDGLKISTNSLFGKSGSSFSWLCDPTALVRCTVTGQLILLLFVDLVDYLQDCTVITGNTDGLTLKIPTPRVAEIKQALNDLAATLNLQLEWVQYKLIARRAINDYFGVLASGEVKGKGAYGYAETRLKSKAINRVAIDAMQQFFTNQTPTAQTIRECSNIEQFINYFKCPKHHSLIGGDGANYGRLARWYIGTRGDHLDKVHDDNGKKTQIVEAGAVVIADLPDSLPDDIDYAWYIACAERLVKDVLEPEHRERSTIPIAELSAAQREILAQHQAAKEADPARCDAISLDTHHTEYAKLSKGNRTASMYHQLLKVWLQQRGTMSCADLAWCGSQLDNDDYFAGPTGRSQLQRMAEHIGRKISPFPIPRTLREIAERALTWAKETVEPLKRPNKKMHHKSVFDSSYINGDAVRKFARLGDHYKLACSVSAAIVKNHIDPDPTFVERLLNEATQHFSEAQQADEAL